MPITGMMIFDSSDVNSHVAKGSFESIVLHEMGHVLGLGSLWSFPPQLYDGTIYKGERANAEFRSISGLESTVPVEKEGDAGIAHGHFDEACLGNELMTGYFSPDMKASRITLGALEDLGYTVDMTQADDFDMPENAVCDDSRRKLRAGALQNGVRHLTRRNSSRSLSQAGHEKAVAYGESLLRSGHVNIFLDDHSSSNEVVDVGIGHYSVLFVEGDTVFEVEV